MTSPENTNDSDLLSVYKIPINDNRKTEVKRQFACRPCHITYGVFTKTQTYVCPCCGKECEFLENVDVLSDSTRAKRNKVKNYVSDLRPKNKKDGPRYNPYKGIMEPFDDKSNSNT